MFGADSGRFTKTEGEALIDPGIALAAFSLIGDQHNRHSLSAQPARDFFIQILSAVDYCHSQNVYHRDLKLENVLLKNTTSNTIKISDFGMAKDTNVSSMPSESEMPDAAAVPERRIVRN